MCVLAAVMITASSTISSSSLSSTIGHHHWLGVVCMKMQLEVIYCPGRRYSLLPLLTPLQYCVALWSWLLWPLPPRFAACHRRRSENAKKDSISRAVEEDGRAGRAILVATLCH